MIDKNLVIIIHDDKFKSLLSRRGVFPINFLWNSPDEFTNINDGLEPSPNQDAYRCIDVLKCIANMNRSNFIELLFGIPKKEIEYNQSNKLF